MTLTRELKQAVEEAGDEPVRVEDPETHTAYVVIKEDLYRKLSESVPESDFTLHGFPRTDPPRMKILDRLPIYEEPTLIEVRGEADQVWKNQAIVWVRLAEVLAPFPAILDTGHSHNLSIARRHIERWGPRDLKPIGYAKIAGHLVPRYSSESFVGRNKPGRWEFAGTYCLKMDGGIAVVPDELADCPPPAPAGNPDNPGQQAPAPDRRRSAAGNAEDEGLVLKSGT